MFTDECLDSVNIQSHAKAEIYIRDQLCQTKPIKDVDKSCQTITRHDMEVQTNVERELPQATRLAIDTSKNLTKFMLCVYPMMSEQLIANMRSHCFDGYDVNWEETNENNEITCTHTLSNVKNTNLKVTSLTWNSHGSVIAASLGWTEHESWCVHQSFVYLWNVDRSKIDEENPYKIIDCDTCLLDISFHPNQPGLLAGGNFAGKLLIWDLSNEEQPLVCYSGKDTISHHEAISKVRWRNSSKLRSSELVTVGYDGCILIWEFSQLDRELKLLYRYLLVSSGISRSFRKKGMKSDLEIGVTSVDFRVTNQDALFIGCENGDVFRCTLDANKSRKIQHQNNETYLSPVSKTFRGHVAAVNAINQNPHSENIFMTCASDTSVHIYDVQQVEPIITIEPSSDYLYNVQWSPCRPAVFYVCTSKGKLLVFDMTLNSVAPLATVNVVDNNIVQCLSCNGIQKNIMATGDAIGVVKLWQLPLQFTQENAGERSYFDSIKDDD